MQKCPNVLMLALHSTILLWSCNTYGLMKDSTLIVIIKHLKLLSIDAKMFDFNFDRKLAFNHRYESFEKRLCFRFVSHKICSCTSTKILNNHEKNPMTRHYCNGERIPYIYMDQFKNLSSSSSTYRKM